MAARAVMLQGTGSSVGKSVLVAGLARAFTRRGLRVRPFKPQNMSNNAAVTADGGEIGRAQALQARAARVASSVHMNPVLLKPHHETGSQVVVQGKVYATARARAYQDLKPRLMPYVLDSFQRLQRDCDLVLVEGAGSASEVNLRRYDIANMGFARATGTPVVLVGDIDRGGVIASLVGTHSVIDPLDARLIQGFVVNRMRGDPSLFADGMTFVAARTGWSPLGLVPYLSAVERLPAEDAADLRASLGCSPRQAGRRLKIVVPMLPRIANFDDLDPLRGEAGVELCMLPLDVPVPGDTDVVILPGSKTTLADLHALRDAGWEVDLRAHLRRGGHILGLCGGYQMLGSDVSDPAGIEGPAGQMPGLGMLAVRTVLAGDKCLREVQGVLTPALGADVPMRGYEMHIGRTEGMDTARPFVHLRDGRVDGACSPDSKVVGTYVHGLLEDDAARAALLRHWGADVTARSHMADVDAALDELAAHLEHHMDLDAMLKISTRAGAAMHDQGAAITSA